MLPNRRAANDYFTAGYFRVGLINRKFARSFEDGKVWKIVLRLPENVFFALFCFLVKECNKTTFLWLYP